MRAPATFWPRSRRRPTATQPRTIQVLGEVIVVGGDPGTLTLIDPKQMKATASIKVGGSLEFPAPDGKGRVYINAEDTNEIVVVDLRAGKVVTRYPMPGCHGPTGLALVKGGRLVSSCANGVAKILNAADGREIASLAIGVGPDAVLYDSTRNLALVPSGPIGDPGRDRPGGPAGQYRDRYGSDPDGRTHRRGRPEVRARVASHCAVPSDDDAGPAAGDQAWNLRGPGAGPLRR